LVSDQGTILDRIDYNIEQTAAHSKKAIEELHNKNIFDLPDSFYIQKAQPRSEREMEIRSNLAKLSIEGKSFKRNLYVTNIPENCGENEVNDTFSKYGQIISISVGMDSKSRQNTNFAYVCFSKPEEANMALQDSHSISICSNKLSVSLFKSKRERMLERENNNFMYQPGSNPYPRIGGLYERGPDVSNDTRVYNDLYRLVYSLAPAYQEMWGNVDVDTRPEFAEKIAHMLLKKSKAEIRNMIELSSVLMENVSNAVKRYDDEDSKAFFKKK